MLPTGEERVQDPMHYRFKLLFSFPSAVYRGLIFISISSSFSNLKWVLVTESYNCRL